MAPFLPPTTPPPQIQQAPHFSQGDLNQMRPLLIGSIAARMAKDHIDTAHTGLPQQDIRIIHFAAHALSAITGQLELMVDNPRNRTRILGMMKQSYERAGIIDRKYNLTAEFAQEGGLDKAVKAAQTYLQSLDPTADRSLITPEQIRFKTAKGTISGAELVNYFISDALKDAYELVFAKLGVSFGEKRGIRP